eukprot:TRINITY_DN75708_c0_g1_i1.p1 TRINITY_DN75708_c0_g1~~TRINITY_DN75708_c0_g1_i1.p1  ORF type:complete len:352 (+),score=35.27 TRINITY_DN75708_c0_g1_i1:87-1058(+)
MHFFAGRTLLVSANINPYRRVMLVPIWVALVVTAVLPCTDARSLRAARSSAPSGSAPCAKPVAAAGRSRLPVRVQVHKTADVEPQIVRTAIVPESQTQASAHLLEKKVSEPADMKVIGFLQPPLVRSTIPLVAMLWTEVVVPHACLKTGTWVLLAIVAVILTLAAIALALGVLYDGVARWLHRARFHACKAQISRINQATKSKKDEFVLCPCCIEPASSNRSPTNVVFLCGHRFHTECTNKWYAENPEVTTYCPICVNAALEDPQADGALSFILWSLHWRYPEIITKVCIARWLHSSPELWMSELKCPKYKSIFGKQHWQCFD